MKRIGVVVTLLLISSLALFGFGGYQGGEVSATQLREMLTQLGYEVKDIVKDPGKEKYSVVISRDGLDIPVGYELSGNKGYIWLTANLGPAPSESSPKNFNLLKQNALIQPSQFYVTPAGLLMMALPIENRGVNNALLRQRSDALAANVGKTKDVWQAK